MTSGAFSALSLSFSTWGIQGTNAKMRGAQQHKQVKRFTHSENNYKKPPQADKTRSDWLGP